MYTSVQSTANNQRKVTSSNSDLFLSKARKQNSTCKL